MLKSKYLKRIVALLILETGLLLNGCKDMGTDPAPVAADTPPQQQTPSGATVSFRQNVRPIFSNPSFGCIGCHGGTSGLSVGTVAGLLQGGIHGPAVVAGNSGQSILVQKLGATPPFGERMPLGGNVLPDSTIQLIKTWIDQGANDN
jgi:hypothetical protein